jgi:MFS family permease
MSGYMLNFAAMKEETKFFDIKMKPSFSRANLLALPCILFISSLAGNFINSQMIFLLRDPNYYDVNSENIGKVSNDLIFYSILSGQVCTLVLGYLYDIFGRKKTIITSCIMLAMLLFLVPLCAPHVYPWLIFVRIGVTLCFIAPQCNPLASDYVKRMSRGAAAALTNMGIVLGEFTTFAFLLNLSKYVNPEASFAITSSIILVFSIMFLFIIKEPNMRKIHLAATPSVRRRSFFNKKFEELSVFARFKLLTKNVLNACKKNIALPLCFIGTAINRCAVIL